MRLPDGIDFDAGACLGIPAMTAHRAVFADGPVTGQVVLVTGGAGAVGTAAVQFAKWGGATVLATVSSDAKAAAARDAGADHTINYKTDDVVAAVRRLTGDAAWIASSRSTSAAICRPACRSSSRTARSPATPRAASRSQRCRSAR